MHEFIVITWGAYDITKYSFYTKSKDDCSTVKNSGVMVEDKSMYFSSSKNKNHVITSRVYFGVIEEILKINYVIFKVSLFKCKWIKSNNDVEIDELRFTRVDL